ncbi:TIR domain-containing protein, partial [candidate division KSB3 bacterium]|nr:TIR domain-containing protein [candidate division KSB3 bacterium]MBD3323887.1 TIR domain-containing protein [candidate division KSB3 bacterium]
MNPQYDIFISYASGDKEKIARPLAEALREAGLNVWYDEFILKPGDNLNRSIREGQKNSRCALLILSRNYFSNERWAQHELDGFVTRGIYEDQVIIPVCHGVTHEDVVRFSPDIANKFALYTSRGLETVVQQILLVFAQDAPVTEETPQPADEIVQESEEPLIEVPEVDLAEALEEYREIVEPFIGLTAITPRQRQVLERNRERLKLSKEAIERIEQELRREMEEQARNIEDASTIVAPATEEPPVMPAKGSPPAKAGAGISPQAESQPKAKKSPIHLRSEPLTVSKHQDAREVFQLDGSAGFFVGSHPLEYIENDYERQGDVVVDHATGLMWQQSGSDKELTYTQAQQYVKGLNQKKFAGYDDWRLPT